ncbi:hypothetical protein [Endozoicomonas euniceicola]|uniref:Uncharacterized protein n=1 Tax=Endozoicomonas euniceicola TaxID=1234143 RepID=A0ABY6GUZ1_9GAMM|nr:hypothetical protein [Endozoicomonas euniceicola]UYM16589.1 hypothetical protein NX720_01265 [Endozoicomonas euniceicola]
MQIKYLTLVLVLMFSLARTNGASLPLPAGTASNNTLAVNSLTRDSLVILLTGTATSKVMEIICNLVSEYPSDSKAVICQQLALGSVPFLITVAAPWAGHYSDSREPHLPRDYVNTLSAALVSMGSSTIKPMEVPGSSTITMIAYPVVKELLNDITRFSEPPVSKSGGKLAEIKGKFIKMYMVFTGILTGCGPVNVLLWYQPDPKIPNRMQEGPVAFILISLTIIDFEITKGKKETGSSFYVFTRIIANAAFIIVADIAFLLRFSTNVYQPAYDKYEADKYAALALVAPLHMITSAAFTSLNAALLGEETGLLGDSWAKSANIFGVGTVIGAILGAFVGKEVAHTQSGIGTGAILGTAIGTLLFARFAGAGDTESDRVLSTATATASAETAALIIAALAGSGIAKRLPYPHPDSGYLIKLAYTGGYLLIIPWTASLAKFVTDNIPVHETMHSFVFLFEEMRKFLFSDRAYSEE